MKIFLLKSIKAGSKFYFFHCNICFHYALQCYRFLRNNRHICFYVTHYWTLFMMLICVVSSRDSICEMPSDAFRRSNINISFDKSLQNVDRCEVLGLNAVVMFPPCSLHPLPAALSWTLHGVLVLRTLLPFAPRSKQLYSVGGEESWKIVGH